MNERIRAPRVRVIDGTTNKQLGVLQTHEAIKIAKAKGLDLVEITSNVDPPVCKIVEYGKFKYDQSKQKKERNKSKAAARVKEVKFRVRIDTHDYNIKMAHAEEFLDHGHKVRLQLQFRGREMAHQELGMEVMHRVKEDLLGMGHVDMEPRKTGRQILMLMSPLPVHQRKPKFHVREDASRPNQKGPVEGDQDDEVTDEEDSAEEGSSAEGVESDAK